ncbi:unnamed protein product, partial [Amoebophrya sp. A120]|eukprot:GSA120T00024505001.1
MRTPFPPTAKISTNGTQEMWKTVVPRLHRDAAGDENTGARRDHRKSTKKCGARFRCNTKEQYETIPPPRHPNKIKTAKHNLLTFLPATVVRTFRQPANIYFLFICLFQILPEITPTNGVVSQLP